MCEGDYKVLPNHNSGHRNGKVIHINTNSQSQAKQRMKNFMSFWKHGINQEMLVLNKMVNFFFFQ